MPCLKPGRSLVACPRKLAWRSWAYDVIIGDTRRGDPVEENMFEMLPTVMVSCLKTLKREGVEKCFSMKKERFTLSLKKKKYVELSIGVITL